MSVVKGRAAPEAGLCFASGSALQPKTKQLDLRSPEVEPMGLGPEGWFLTAQPAMGLAPRQPVTAGMSQLEIEITASKPKPAWLCRR